MRLLTDRRQSPVWNLIGCAHTRPTGMTRLLLLALICLAILGACSSGGPDSTPDPVGTAPPAPPDPDPPLPPPPNPKQPSTLPTSPDPQAAMCPSDTSLDAAVNSAVSIQLDADIDSGTVDDNSLTLRCAGGLMPGSATARSSRLILEPDSELPANSRCEVTLGDNVRYRDGSRVEPVHWTFETGAQSRLEWHFTVPKRLAGVTHTILDTTYVDGRWIIAHRFGARLHISVSDDDGETILHADPIDVLSDPAGATVEEFSMRYSNGVLYLTWSVFLKGYFPEMFLAWSTNEDLLTYSTPLHLPALAPTSVSYSPSIEIDAHGQIYRAWREQCADSLSPTCPHSIDGLHLAVYSPDGQINHFETLTDWTYYSPQLKFVAEDLYIVWGRDPRPDIGTTLRVIEVHNYTAGMLKLAERGKQEGFTSQLRLDGLPGNRALVTWTEKDRLAEEHTHYRMRLDGRTESVSELETITRVSDVAPEWRCSRVSGNEAGQISFMLASAADLYSPAYRGIHLSDDGGSTFHTTMWMDGLGEVYRQKIEGDVTDDLCPNFELTPNGFVHAVWHRVVFTQGAWDHSLVTARANQVSPCSRPTWSTTANGTPIGHPWDAGASSATPIASSSSGVSIGLK